MTGRRFAYVGVAVGLIVSVAANVAHAMATMAARGGAPGALAFAAFWPLGLFIALEVLTRTRWSGRRAPVVARCGVGLVAGVAAVVSYLHLHGLLELYGEAPVSALLGPLAIDGLMAVSAAALLSEGADPVSAPEPASVPVSAAPSSPRLVSTTTTPPATSAQLAPSPVSALSSHPRTASVSASSPDSPRPGESIADYLARRRRAGAARAEATKVAVAHFGSSRLRTIQRRASVIWADA